MNITEVILTCDITGVDFERKAHMLCYIRGRLIIYIINVIYRKKNSM